MNFKFKQMQTKIILQINGYSSYFQLYVHLTNIFMTGVKISVSRSPPIIAIGYLWIFEVT